MNLIYCIQKYIMSNIQYGQHLKIEDPTTRANARLGQTDRLTWRELC